MASTTGTVRPVLRLVWPVLLEQVLGLSVGFTDKWLAGNLLEGAEYLAGGCAEPVPRGCRWPSTSWECC